MKRQKAKRKRGRPKTHGLSRTMAYRSLYWITYVSKHRWYSKKYYGYPISLCKEWQGKKGIIQFYQDMGERPAHAILQVRDVTQPFSKTNCHWEQRTLFIYFFCSFLISSLKALSAESGTALQTVPSPYLEAEAVYSFR